MKIEIIDFGYEIEPNRAHEDDAGLDVYATDTHVLEPGEVYSMGLGFGVKIPAGFCGFITCRSGMAKEGIVTALTPIDAGYTGEVHAILMNKSNKPQLITRHQKIAQLVILPCILCDLVKKKKARGNNAFGSTGK